MSLENELRLAQQTWDLCHSQLSPVFRAAVAPHGSDPQPLDTKGYVDSVARLRILPTERKPQGFWDSSWCFYEIVVGPIDQFSDNKRCSRGAWYQAVLKILTAVKAKHPDDFDLTPTSSKGHPKPQLHERYKINPHKVFPVSLAASDLAWLIEQTLPQFQALR